MKLRLTLALMAILVAAPAFSRGGETGTLDEGENKGTATSAPVLMPVGGRWTPHYMSMDRFRRLRARLSMQPIAPVPGWDAQHAWRYSDRYFTQDGIYELFPLYDGQK